MQSQAIKGRGSASNPALRYAGQNTVRDAEHEAPPARLSEFLATSPRSIIARNQSPDVPFDRSINPYQGCEHGCVYCYARPTHAWHDLSPGLDFETKILYKPNAARLLEHELAAPGYECQPIALGANTDPWQPMEKKLGITRGILELLWRHRHPLTIVTKGNLLERDLDLLANMAAENLVSVRITLTTLDNTTKRTLEPRAASPSARLALIEQLASRNIPVGILLAPLIPAINDHEIEAILEAASSAGARCADYVLLRLPLEVAPLFEQWLQQHHPLRARHVMSLVRQAHQGKAYRSEFGVRQRGSGPYVNLLASRFASAVRRYALDQPEPPLDCSRFSPPLRHGQQLSLI